MVYTRDLEVLALKHPQKRCWVQEAQDKMQKEMHLSHLTCRFHAKQADAT